jgi:hypothetical protein
MTIQIDNYFDAGDIVCTNTIFLKSAAGSKPIAGTIIEHYFITDGLVYKLETSNGIQDVHHMYLKLIERKNKGFKRGDRVKLNAKCVNHISDKSFNLKGKVLEKLEENVFPEKVLIQKDSGDTVILPTILLELDLDDYSIQERNLSILGDVLQAIILDHIPADGTETGIARIEFTYRPPELYVKWRFELSIDASRLPQSLMYNIVHRDSTEKKRIEYRKN